jgi:hypothetical protein
MGHMALQLLSNSKKVTLFIRSLSAPPNPYPDAEVKDINDLSPSAQNGHYSYNTRPRTVTKKRKPALNATIMSMNAKSPSTTPYVINIDIAS